MTLRRQRGFTLIEVMVALAVFSTAAAAVLSATQYLIWQTGSIGERSMAAWIADNRLNELRLRREQSVKAEQDELLLFGGRQWRLMTVTDTDDSGLRRTTIRVYALSETAAGRMVFDLSGYIEAAT